MSDTSTQKRCFGLNWQINVNSGWGVLGLNLAIQAERTGRWQAVPLVESIHEQWIPEEHRPFMEQVFARERMACKLLAERPAEACHCDFPVIHGLGNWLEWGLSEDQTDRVVGRPDLAIIFLEDTHLTDKARVSSRKFARILGGSSWNTEVLKKNGIPHVATLLQGVDLSVFQPVPKASTSGRPFVIFSGGKLEYRKGQDIVVAAFRKFYQRHSDAMLLTGWQNAWPKTIGGIDRRGYVTGSPEINADGRLEIVNWLEANGVPRRACHDIGAVPNYVMPQAYKQTDVAILPNRCEGGTNLVAMECLASGIPTILSANTGHLDLIDERHCYPLTRQGPVEPVFPFRGTDGWGESDVDEIVERLEQIYRDRQEAERRAAAAVRFMQDWSWEKRFQELTQHLESLSS